MKEQKEEQALDIDSIAKITTKKNFLVLMERHVGRHCGRDFKLPWQQGWPLGWPESTKAPFFLGFLFMNCLVACSGFNLSSHGHSKKKKTRFAWQYRPFLVRLAGLTG